MDTMIILEQSNASRNCVICGQEFHNSKTDICSSCQRKGNKIRCPIDGCAALINPRAFTCLKHRHLRERPLYESCAECGAKYTKSSTSPVCKECRESVFVQCACGCGHYRRKYNNVGQKIAFISGHNDNWSGKNIPELPCAYCGRIFKPSRRKTRLCGNECKKAWMKLNPPGKTQKILTRCRVCGKEIYKRKTDLRKNPNPTCSGKCQYIAVAQALSGPRTSGKKFALLRDDNKCRICDFDVVVHVHHIDPKRRGGQNSVENLVTLCPNHHAMADRGMISAEELLELIKDESNRKSHHPARSLSS